jgi:hypothetical protein
VVDSKTNATTRDLQLWTIGEFVSPHFVVICKTNGISDLLPFLAVVDLLPRAVFERLERMETGRLGDELAIEGFGCPRPVPSGREADPRLSGKILGAPSWSRSDKVDSFSSLPQPMCSSGRGKSIVTFKRRRRYAYRDRFRNDVYTTFWFVIHSAAST